jgi:mono/diheme cytochrome c family protein
MIRTWKLFSVSLLAAALAYGARDVAAQDKACVAWGKQLFLNNCASCHGEGGGGNGPAANALKTAPTDLTLISKTHEGKFPREWVSGFIEGSATLGSHGKREMPIWGQIFTKNSSLGTAGAQAAIGALTDYIATIQKP